MLRGNATSFFHTLSDTGMNELMQQLQGSEEVMDLYMALVLWRGGLVGSRQITLGEVKTILYFRAKEMQHF